MVIPFSDVESLDGKRFEAKKTETNKPAHQTKAKFKPASSPKSASKPVNLRTAQNTVDIRGKRVHLAQPILEKAIASATEMGLLWIVHGKGTGTLRQGVHEFLQTHPQVDRFELAPQNQGGAGVTIAYLI